MFMGVGRVGRQTPAGSALLPSLDLNLLSSLDTRVVFSRASSATDSFYTDATGSGFNTYLSNVSRMLASGLLIEEQRTNSILNSGSPVTQTTPSLAIGTYTLWMIGTGSATSSAGTATGSGFGAATAGVPNVFTLTVAGTITVTVTGSLTRFQLENGAFPTSYISTTVAAATRAADIVNIPISSWFNPNIGTLAVECILSTVPATQNTELVGIGADFGNTIRLFINSAASVISAHTVKANVSTLILSTVTPVVAGAITKGILTYNVSNAITVAVNGGTVASGTSTGLPATFASLWIGGSSGARGNPINNVVRRVRYWPRVLSAAEL